jgi:hypothetical protein
MVHMPGKHMSYMPLAAIGILAVACLVFVSNASAVGTHWEDYGLRPRAQAVSAVDQPGTRFGSSDSQDLTIWRGSQDRYASPLDDPLLGEGEVGVMSGTAYGGFRDEEPRWSAESLPKAPASNNGLTEPVPEPATVWLIGTGLLLFGGGLRRRSSR